MPEVVEALKRKYDRPDDEAYLPSSDNTSDVVYSLRARRALLWSLSDYESSQRRWAAPPQRLGEA